MFEACRRVVRALSPALYVCSFGRSVGAADGRTMFVFTHLLRELRLDCTMKNGSGLLLGLCVFFFFFFPTQHNFPPVNWSVFASLSTPAKQHLPWSYRISIRYFPNVAALTTPMFLLLHGCLSVIFALGSYSLLLLLLWGKKNLPGFSLKIRLEFPTSLFMLFSS